MPLLQVKDLALGYDGQAIVEGVNFEVHAGDYLFIVGENGSGKTTLMKTLLHLQSPLSGRITPGDGLKDNEIGYLPQQTQIQKDFPASIREVVMSGLQGRKGIKAFYTRQDREEADRNMERMGILDIADKCYRDLSGGQQQRVLLARALCATQKLLLLDEPVSGLDPQVTSEMYGLIDKLNKLDANTKNKTLLEIIAYYYNSQKLSESKAEKKNDNEKWQFAADDRNICDM